MEFFAGVGYLNQQHPHAWDLRTPPLQWRLGPTDARSPERVNVIGEGEKG